MASKKERKETDIKKFYIDESMMGVCWLGNLNDLRKFSHILSSLTGINIDIVNDFNGASEKNNFELSDATWMEALDIHSDLYPDAWA